MNQSLSDALVFFGATGDLAFKKIFPALHAMVTRGNPKVCANKVPGVRAALSPLVLEW
jgi:glucose-6-phosphate 1-dehydrogenase